MTRHPREKEIGVISAIAWSLDRNEGRAEGQDLHSNAQPKGFFANAIVYYYRSSYFSPKRVLNIKRSVGYFQYN